MTQEPAAGDPAPDFSLPTDDGRIVSLGDFRGRRLVLYFYPKADTPGCTLEAQDFSRLQAEFQAVGASVLGVSPDPANAQARFKSKCGLTIPLACDEGHQAALAYRVWKEKSMYGRKFMGIERATFLIGEDARIVRIWRNVKVAGHAEAALAAVRTLSRQA